jgi:dipeptide/tripeptide permease
VARFAERFAHSGARLLLFFLLGATVAPQWYTSAFAYAMLAFGLGPIAGGVIIDMAWQPRPALLWGGLALAVGYFTLGLPFGAAPVAGAALVVMGAALYLPASVALPAGYYRGREQYLPAGMHWYAAAAVAGTLLGSVFFGAAMSVVDYRQGFMLCGIAMLAGHIYLLGVAKAYQEPYLKRPELLTPAQATTHSRLHLAYGVVALLAFYGVAHAFGVSMRQWSGVAVGQGITNLAYYAGIIAFLAVALYSASALTRTPVPPLRRAAVGALVAAVAVLLVPVYTRVGVQQASSLGFGMAAVALIHAAEALLMPTVWAMAAQRGGKYRHALLGVCAAASYWPAVLWLTGSEVAITMGLGCAIVLTSAGLGLFLAGKRRAKQG